MRIIHTADWHLGRRFRGIDRTSEIAIALEQMLKQAKELDVDAVLVAGDIFDVPNPPAYAERIAYHFFCELQAAGIPAIAIAGNHDSASRIDSIAQLLSLAGVRALGKPKRSADGGSITLNTKSGKLCVGAMPFASEQRLLDANSLWHSGDANRRQNYREIVTDLLQNLTRDFRDNTVNMLMAHMSIDGARLAKSEVAYYTQEKYLHPSQTLPPEAQYVALGHIHIHQRIAKNSPAYYSGSLIQLDFGEAEQEKGFCLIEVEPGSQAKVEFKPVACNKPLKVLKCDNDNLDAVLEAHQYHPGFLKVIVDLDSPQIGLADRVRQICSQAVSIEPRYRDAPLEATEITNIDPNNFDPAAEFCNYYQNRLGRTPQPAVLEGFQDLYNKFKETANN
ncbi:exonuclease SbcCD subunit D [Tychonema sp. LEGE 07203]|uniref:metallophosphoesterase family protein n=1 Tax=Tychonema sp. LEGE 07203 TaxID=1828671 RepID=UPI001882FE13|nr:exonuclease SbcCD subunit D [Tychonema sp. LEGE 07203]MBE9097550.1 exonuclease SbcCD subunit D [Tychonema sp. LEGE 07203]